MLAFKAVNHVLLKVREFMEKHYSSTDEFYSHDYILFEKEGFETVQTQEKLLKSELEKNIVKYLKEKPNLEKE